jgi:hypothetical protein
MENTRDVETTVQANDAVVMVKETILFFENLIDDVVDHCKIPNHQDVDSDVCVSTYELSPRETSEPLWQGPGQVEGDRTI